MAEITTSGSDADLRFEARWGKALGQPEVSIVDAKKLTIDVSPRPSWGACVSWPTCPMPRAS